MTRRRAVEPPAPLPEPYTPPTLPPTEPPHPEKTRRTSKRWESRDVMLPGIDDGPRYLLYGEQRIGGKLQFAHYNKPADQLWCVVELAAGQCNALLDVKFSDGRSAPFSGPGVNRWQYWWYPGTPAGEVCAAMAAAVPGWNEAFAGTSYVVFVLRKFGSYWKATIPDFVWRFQARICDLPEGGAAYSENVWNQWYDYVRHAEGKALPATRVDAASFVAARTSDVTNGIKVASHFGLMDSTDPDSAIETFRLMARAFWFWDSDRFRVVADRAGAPVATYDDAHVSAQTDPDLTRSDAVERANKTTIWYTDIANGWQLKPYSYPETDPVGVDIVEEEYRLPHLHDPAQVKELAYYLHNSRLFDVTIRERWLANTSERDLGDIVTRTLEEHGLTLDARLVGRTKNPDGTYEVELQQHDNAKFAAFALSDAPKIASTLPDPGELPPDVDTGTVTWNVELFDVGPNELPRGVLAFTLPEFAYLQGIEVWLAINGSPSRFWFSTTSSPVVTPVLWESGAYQLTFRSRQSITQELTAGSVFNVAVTGANDLPAGPPGPPGPALFTLATHGTGAYLTSANSFGKLGPAGFNGGVYSLEGFEKDLSVSFRNTGTYATMAGLNSDPTATAGYGDIDYCWYFYTDGTLRIYEGGVQNPANFGAYTVDTVLSITYDGSYVRYYKDGALMRSVARPVGAKLHFDSSISTSNVDATVTMLRDITFTRIGASGAAPFTLIPYGVDTVAIFSPNSCGKTVTSSWDGGVRSAEKFERGAFCSFSVPNTASVLMAGLDADPTATASYTDLDYAWYVTGGVAYSRINGSNQLDHGAFTAATVFAIDYDGEQVRWYKDGVMVRQTSRSPAAAGLYFDSSLNSGLPGAQIINITFGPMGTKGDPSAVNLATTELWEITPSEGYGAYSAAGKFGGDFAAVADGTARVWAKDPFGRPALIWKGKYNLGAGFPQTGGWLKNVDVQVGKSYIVFCYVRRVSDVATGQIYFGCGTGAKTLTLAGAANSNPYWLALNSSALEKNKWYVMVGLLHADNSTVGSAVDVGGLYRLEDATRVMAASEFRNASGNVLQTHRCFGPYNASDSTEIEFWSPGWYEINGNEPSLDQIIGKAGPGVGPVTFVPVGDPGLKVVGANALARPTNTVSAWTMTAAYSAQSYKDGFYLSFKVNQTDKFVFMAVTDAPPTGGAAFNLDTGKYGWYVYGDGTNKLDIRVLAAMLPNISLTYTTDTLLAIRHDGEYMQFLRDGVVVATVKVTPATALSLFANIYNGNNLGSPMVRDIVYIPAAKGDPADKVLAKPETAAAIGGRLLAAATAPTKLAADLGVGGATLTVDDAVFANGSVALLSKVVGSTVQTEYIVITSAASGTGPYTYTVSRNADGSGMDAWLTGDVIVNLGVVGSSFIDIYAVRGLKSATEVGPTIAGNIKTGAGWNAWEPRWAIGNLKGLYGYAADTFGAAFGVPSGAWLKIDPVNGMRAGHNATTKFSIDAAGNVSLAGSIAADSGSIGAISIGALALTAGKLTIHSAGRITIADGAAAYATASTYLWADSTGKFSLGNKFKWDGSSLDFTVGPVTMSNLGIEIDIGLSKGPTYAYKFDNGVGVYGGSSYTVWLQSTDTRYLRIASSGDAFFSIGVEVDGNLTADYVNATAGFQIGGTLVLNGKLSYVADATATVASVQTQLNALLAQLRSKAMMYLG